MVPISYQRFFLIVLVLAWALLPAAAAQPARFTVDDLLDVVNVSPAALSRDGRWLVITESTPRDRLGVDSHRYGDPTYLAPGGGLAWIVDTLSGRRTQLYPERLQLRSFEWAPDGSRLAFLKRRGDEFSLVLWEPSASEFTEAAVPDGHVVDPQTPPRWSAAGDRVFFGLHTTEWVARAREGFETLTAADIVVRSSENPFLAWEELRRMAQLRSVAAFDVASGDTAQIVPETRLLGVRHSRDGLFHITVEDETEKTDYETIGGTVSRIRVIPADGGEARTIREGVKGSSRGTRMTWSRHNGHYAYAEKGRIFFASIHDDEPRQLTGEEDEAAAEESSAEPDGDDDEEKPETFSPQALSPDGGLLVASSRTGLWLIRTEDGSKTRFIDRDEEDDQAPAYRVLDWGPGALYLSYGSRTVWQRGFVRYDLETGELADLVKDDRLYRGFRLSDDGRTAVFQAADGNRPYDVYAADAGLSNVRRLTEANPALDDSRLGRTELITYLDVDGKTTHGVLYYPLDYVEGTRYPTVFNIYESYFDNTYSGTIAVMNAHGYAVVRPSVNFERGYPGEAWVKGVTAAANKVIEMGVADPKRLGVHGTSYGGYATNLLIAQTQRFKAAINISGKVNMVSFYTDSPRLGTRNIHAPENSQDRIGATLWDQPQKYIAHSAVMFADRIKTPLLLMTGEQDHNVPARQAMEMYYALRRLGRIVEWVSYTNGGHGMPRTNAAEVHDYHRRILEWYEKYLKADDEERKETA